MSTNAYRGLAQIKRVSVVGGGLVGADWIAYFLARGLEVSAYGRRLEAETEMRARIDLVWPQLQEVGFIVPGASKDRWSFSTDLEASLKDCDFVQENLSENEALKVEIFARIDAVLPKDVLIASSTSSLPITKLQQQCRFPERCVLGHPFTPTHLMPLVEVAGGEKTDPAAVDMAMQLYADLGKKPVKLNKEIFGHIANRLASALWREAVHLVDSGVASVEDVDAALVYGPGRKWALAGTFISFHISGGPGGFAHFLDHFGAGQQKRWDQLGQPNLTPELRARLIERVADSTKGLSREKIEERRNAGLVALTKALKEE